MFAPIWNVKQFDFTHRKDPIRCYLSKVRLDLVAIAMKAYSAFPKAPALLEHHHQIVLCHIQDTGWERVLPHCRDAVGVFYSPSRLGWSQLEGRVWFILFSGALAQTETQTQGAVPTFFNCNRYSTSASMI